jgi:hypothetical protein
MTGNGRDKQVKQVIGFATAMATATVAAMILADQLWRQAEQRRPTLRERIRYIPVMIYYMIEDAVDALWQKMLEWLKDKICECEG